MSGSVILVEHIAHLCHETNRTYCRSLGDDSQPAWEDAPEWQRQSARNGVAFHLANPGAGPAASHESWLKEKTEQGWVYGEVKDPDARTHPCCVPYDALPLAQRLKDEFFVNVVRHCAALVVEVTR